jgi:hypothetical protein
MASSQVRDTRFSGMERLGGSRGRRKRPFRGAGQPGHTTDILLTNRWVPVTVFQNCRGRVGSRASSARAIRGLGGGGSQALAIRAKRKGDQVVENKQFREMSDFAPPIISRTYDPVAKPSVSFGEMNSSAFAWFFRPSRPERKDRETNRGFRVRAAEVARLNGSEMAPQALEMAQNRLGDGVAGFAVAGRENRSGELPMRGSAHAFS